VHRRDRVTRPSEDEIIARFFAPFAGEAGLGLKDDAANLRPRDGFDLVITTDCLVAGVHFFPHDPPASIAAKALGVNLSDLAAKGADPVGFLLGLALPSDWTEEWLGAFAHGLDEAARSARCPLLGGDTVRASGGLTLSITALGEVPAGRMVRRTTARSGDRVCVTGTIGDATLGLAIRDNPGWAALLSSEDRAFLDDRYLHPRPRNDLAEALRAHANSAMDVSDGLAGDIAKLLRTASLGAVIETDKVPLSRAAQAALAAEPRLIDRILTGGDDYEVLCTVSPDHLDAMLMAAQRAAIPLTPIGTVSDEAGVPVFRSAEGDRRYPAGSFSHF
jgi:thiamine-monophosphate kinase